MDFKQTIEANLNSMTIMDMKYGILRLYRVTAALTRLMSFICALNLMFLLGIFGFVLYQYAAIRPLIDGILLLWNTFQTLTNLTLLGLCALLAWVFERVFVKWINNFVKKTLAPSE